MLVKVAVNYAIVTPGFTTTEVCPSLPHPTRLRGDSHPYRDPGVQRLPSQVSVASKKTDETMSLGLCTHGRSQERAG